MTSTVQEGLSSFDWTVIILIILYLVGELLAMQAGKLTNSRQLRKLSGRKSIGGRQSMSGGVRSSAMARGSFVAHIRKSRSEESEKNLGNSQFWLKKSGLIG